MTDSERGLGPVEFFQLRYTRADLNHVPEEDAVFFFMACQLHNDIAALFRMLLLHRFRGEGPEPAQHAAAATFFLCIRMLAGRLHEGWKLTETRFSRVFRDYSGNIAPAAQDDFQSLRTYFGSPNLIKDIRNKAGFHTDIDQFTEGYRRLEQWEDFVDSHAWTIGNTVFHGGEILMMSTLIALTNKDDPGEALDHITDEVRRIAGAFLSVTGGFARAFCQRHLNDRLAEMHENRVVVPRQPDPERYVAEQFLYVPDRSPKRGKPRRFMDGASHLPLRKR